MFCVCWLSNHIDKNARALSQMVERVDSQACLARCLRYRSVLYIEIHRMIQASGLKCATARKRWHYPYVVSLTLPFIIKQFDHDTGRSLAVCGRSSRLAIRTPIATLQYTCQGQDIVGHRPVARNSQPISSTAMYSFAFVHAHGMTIPTPCLKPIRAALDDSDITVTSVFPTLTA